MWKHLILAGTSLVALRGAAQDSVIEWSYVNQTLREMSQDALASFPFLRSLDVEFDEQNSDLEKGKLALQFRTSTDQMKWENGQAEMGLRLNVADAGPVVDGKRPVKASVAIEMRTATLAALQTYFETEASGCEGLATRDESYDKFKDEMLCPMWEGLQSARSVQDMYSVLVKMKDSTLKKLPVYIQTAQGTALKRAQEDFAMVQKLKLGFEGGQLSMSLGFDVVSIEKLRVDLRLKLNAETMSLNAVVTANAEESKYQQTKSELFKWLVKLQDKDSNSLNLLRLAVFAYGQNLGQKIAQ